MNGRKKYGLALIVFVLVISLASCGTEATTIELEEEADDLTGEIMISAAASLTNVMSELRPLFEKQYPNLKLVLNLGSSGSLQQQIEQGAPVDVFISAASKQMNALDEKSLIESTTRKDLLKNEVVLIVPSDGDLSLTFDTLTDDSVKQIGIGDPASVPAGQYGQEVLTYLGVYDEVLPKASLAKDVKAVLAWVETGNVDAGIVYSTDAMVSEKVVVVDSAPEGSHKEITYPVAIVKDALMPVGGQLFIDFLETDEAIAVFEKYGFIMAE